MTDWKSVVVPKDWGREWLCHESPSVACWMLEMGAGHSTSLHSHPGKLTGYIVVEGELTLHFLNSSQRLRALDKAVINPYVPHKSEAMTDCKLIELESPKDHRNLVRFEDDYGRERQPYEPENSYLPRDGETPCLAQGSDLALDGGVVIGLRRIAPGRAYSAWLGALLDDTAVAVMDGELVGGGLRAIVPGHVVWGKDLKRLAGICGVLRLEAEMEVLVAWDTRKTTT